MRRNAQKSLIAPYGLDNVRVNMKKLSVVLGILFVQFSAVAAPIQLNFNWGNSKATVTQVAENAKGQMKTQYEISLTKEDDGYLLSQKNPIVLSVNGEDVRNNPAFQAVAPQLMMPDLLLNKDGIPVEVKNFDTYLKNALSLLGKDASDLITRNPQLKETLYVKAAEPWFLWSANWSGETLELNQPKVTSDMVEAFGSQFPQRIVLTYLGKYKNTPYIEMKYQSTVTNEGIDTKQLLNTIDSIKGGKVFKDGMPQKLILSKQMDVHGVVDPKTLRPQQIDVVTMTKADADGQTKEKTEKRTYIFEWK